MKLGFIGENDLAGVERDAKFAKENGFEGIEYNYWSEFRNLTAETIKQMRAIHEKHGVRASMLGLWGWNHLSPDPKVRKEAHQMLGRAIEFAKALGAEWFVTGAGDMPGEPLGLKVREFLKVFPPFLKKIEKAGLKVAFYPIHGASFLDGIAAFEAVWEHVPDLKIKFDPANWKRQGHDYIEVARRYGKKIGYVHIKEHMYKDGALISEPPAGMGDIQFGKVIALLYEHGYDGWLSIEPHGSFWGRAPLREKMILISKRHICQFLA
ncbi:MAG: sugar phosphate isomerase/epimerase [Planctomycetota bacterium]|nr:sugar phosphate isomerase/epimerase [Planctomycetota bacterium]